MEPMKLGYLALSKASWMTPKIERITAETLESLRTLDAEILFDRIVTTEAEARAEARRFSRAGVDAVILHTVTFPVGATIPAAAQEISATILLLANPEEPGAGGTWEQNSFCGVNMAAHGRRRGGSQGAPGTPDRPRRRSGAGLLHLELRRTAPAEDVRHDGRGIRPARGGGVREKHSGGTGRRRHADAPAERRNLQRSRRGFNMNHKRVCRLQKELNFRNL